jgi:hypothetical protein
LALNSLDAVSRLVAIAVMKIPLWPRGISL